MERFPRATCFCDHKLEHKSFSLGEDQHFQTYPQVEQDTGPYREQVNLPHCLDPIRPLPSRGDSDIKSRLQSELV